MYGTDINAPQHIGTFLTVKKGYLTQAQMLIVPERFRQGIHYSYRCALICHLNFLNLYFFLGQHQHPLLRTVTILRQKLKYEMGYRSE